MEGFEAIQNFFCSMHCSECNNLLKPDGITLLKEEHNYFIVKITCIKCNQPVGLAIVGVEQHSSQIEKQADQVTEEKVTNKTDAPSITYDDVIEAHHFFNNLGPDWMKYINKAHHITGEEFDNSE